MKRAGAKRGRWCLGSEFDHRFCRALRGLRACWHPACAFGSLACWAASGWRVCKRLACMADGNCRQVVRGMRGCQLARMLFGLAAGLADELPASCLRARRSYGLSAAGLVDSPVSRLPAWRSLLGDGMLRLSGSVAPCLRGWASCLRQSILTSGFHVWGPMCRRGFRARRPRSCGLRTEQRVARCAARCTGCFPAWRLFPQ